MARNIQGEITARIIENLKAGTVPWRKPWSGQAEGAMPRNAITGRGYNGVNVPLLWMTAQERGYTSPRWLTFQQAQEAGGFVRKGERGTMVVYVSTFDKKRDDGEIERVPFLKAFTVFNVAQCDNLPSEKDKPEPINPNERDAIADAFMASTGATIVHGEARAYYRPIGDMINMPRFETFSGSAEYYGTAFHELTHWTGAPHRLNRTKGKRFGDSEYSFEELVAELGSAFLCAEFGFDNETIDNSAAYIAHWIKVLTDHEGMFASAASHASKAVEFMRGLAIAEPIAEAA